jgi:hypothetical protein
MKQMSILKGECLCRAIEFEIKGDFKYAFYCHCSQCRKKTGSAFSTIGGVDFENVRLTAGENLLLKEGENSDGYRALCSRCYSTLFSVLMARQRAHVNYGALQSQPSRRPDHHIYVASKASWYEIEDDLPQFPELPQS